MDTLNKLEKYLQNGEMHSFLLELRVLAKEQGGITKLARNTGLARENLYKALSGDANPRFSTVVRILAGLGLSLTVENLNKH